MSSVEEFQESFTSDYITPGHPIAFSGINTIFRYYDRKVPKSDIKEALSKIYAYTVYKDTRRKQHNSYAIFSKRTQLQMDLADVSFLEEENDGVKYIFCALDCFTRFAVCILLKDKESRTVLSALKRIIHKFGTRPRTIFSDKGSEFISRSVKAYCKEKNIKQLFAENHVKASICERFIRTIKRLIFLFLKQKNTLRYVDNFDELLHTYNVRYHRSIKMSPTQAERSESHVQLFRLVRKKLMGLKKEKAQFAVGDLVRIKKLKNLFTRTYDNQFTEEIFTVKSVNTKRPVPTYDLKDLANEEITGKFYAWEMSKVGEMPTHFFIERILKRRKNKKGISEMLVKYKGYPSKFNEWVTEVKNV